MVNQLLADDISRATWLGSSSTESRPRLNSAVEYFGLLSPYTSAMCRWIILAFGVCTILREELYDSSGLNIITFQFLRKETGSKQKVRANNVHVDGTAVIFQLTNVYTAHKWKRNLKLYRKIPSFTDLLNAPLYFQDGGSDFYDNSDLKFTSVGWCFMLGFGWANRCLTSGFL